MFQHQRMTTSTPTSPIISQKLGSNGPSSPCLFCSGPHWMLECLKYKSYPDRINRIRKAQMCTRCLNSRHNSQNCNRPKICRYCKGDHPKALCKEFIENKSHRLPSPLRSSSQQNSIKFTQGVSLAGSVKTKTGDNV